jgi:hypothetical protein
VNIYIYHLIILARVILEKKIRLQVEKMHDRFKGCL